MKFYMLVLALDTTTRRGSAALLRDGALLDCEAGDASRAYGERLPADLIRLLQRHGLSVRDIDLFGVAAGPGSFTGLRIGIATMQGLALAGNRLMVGVSTLDALEKVAEKRFREPFSGGLGKKVPGTVFCGAWMDAQRGEVFSALYRGGELVDPPAAQKPGITLARWSLMLPQGDIMFFVGDGALAYTAEITAAFPFAVILPDVPPLAPAVAQLAAEAAARNEAVPPDTIRPIYVRRSDVELARDRLAAAKKS